MSFRRRTHTSDGTPLCFQCRMPQMVSGLHNKACPWNRETYLERVTKLKKRAAPPTVRGDMPR